MLITSVIYYMGLKNIISFNHLIILKTANPEMLWRGVVDSLHHSQGNVNILGISKLKWTRMGEFNSDDPLYLLLQAGIPQKKWSGYHG